VKEIVSIHDVFSFSMVGWTNYRQDYNLSDIGGRWCPRIPPIFSPFSPHFCVSENGGDLKTAMLKGKTVIMLITHRVLGVHSASTCCTRFADKHRSTPIVFGFLCYGAGTDSGGAYRRLGGDPSFGFEHEPCHGTPEMRKPNTKPLFPGSYFTSFCWDISTLEV
jgi:hypothetical protein